MIGIKKIILNTSSWIRLSKIDIQNYIIANTRLHLNMYKIVNATKKVHPKVAIEKYEQFIEQLEDYLTKNPKQEVYMSIPSYSSLSKDMLNIPTIYIVNRRYRSLTTVQMDNQ